MMVRFVLPEPTEKEEELRKRIAGFFRKYALRKAKEKLMAEKDSKIKSSNITPSEIK